MTLKNPHRRHLSSFRRKGYKRYSVIEKNPLVRNNPSAFPYDKNAPYWNEAVGIPWSEDSTRDLIAAWKSGDSIKEIAMFLQYSEKAVREKMKELRLQPKRSQ